MAIMDPALWADYFAGTIAPLISGNPTASQQKEIAETVYNFPATFDKAVADWAKFKAGVRAGLFTSAQRSEILDWFKQFPQLWETIRPNFAGYRTAEGAYLGIGPAGFTQKVDSWVSTLNGELVNPGLAIAPVVIAGIIIAGALGLAGAFWAVAYIKKQANVSRMIDEVTAGRLSEKVLQTALEQESNFLSPIGEIGGVVKWLALGLAAYFILPVAADWVRGKNK